VGLALVATCALLATACGGGAKSGGDGAAGPGGTMKVTAALGTTSLIMTPILYAKAAGLFAKNGLDVSWGPTIVNASQDAQEVNSGKVDFVFSALSGVALARAQGVNGVQALGQVSQGASYQIVLTNKAVATLKAKGMDASTMTIAQKFQALRGLKIAVAPQGTGISLLFQKGLAQYGVTEKQLTVVPITDGSTMVSQARENRVDGYIWGPPESYEAGGEGFGQIWINYINEVPGFDSMPIASVIAKPSWVADNTEATRRFLTAVNQAENMLKSDPSAVSAVVKKAYYPDLAQKTYDLAFNAMVDVFGHGLVPSDPGVKQAMSIVQLPSGSVPTYGVSDLYNLTVTSAVH
jgi:ABC-type nitrate/sulfonate/bicarbonate transport system substrate-binding protein